MSPRTVLATGLVAVGLVATAVGPAAADEEPTQRDGGAYWSVSMHGGALVPLGTMNDTHQIGLVAGLRIAWTSRIGLGLELSGTYSPLPRQPTPGVATEGHYGTVTVGPHYTLGDGLWRLTFAGGGGMAGEQSRRREGDLDERSRRLLPAVEGGLRLELHMIDGGGLMVGGDYTHTFGDVRYQYASAGGGLILTF